MSSKSLNSNDIKAEALRLGFFACGIAKAEPVDAGVAASFSLWLTEGGNADMGYMTNYLDKRLDPRLLMEGARSIISVAMNYTPAARPAEGEYQLAAYALGKDYHDVVKDRLRQLAAHFGWKDALHNEDGNARKCRIFVDSGPILERYWAERAGLGWTGRNHQLIIPKAGSMFFLGEILVDVELDYDSPMPNRCGNCHACIDACPTKALGKIFHADRCLSYQLIENRGQLTSEAQQSMGDTIYGCDRCQSACPWNRYAHPNTIPEFQPKQELLNMTRQDWQHLSEEQYRSLFKGSAVKRAKYAGLVRNITAATLQEHTVQDQLQEEEKRS